MRRSLALVLLAAFVCCSVCTEPIGITTTNSTLDSIDGAGENETASTTPPSQGDKATKGRALNFTFPDTGNTVAGGNKTKPLDDLSLDDVPMLVMGDSSSTTATTTRTGDATSTSTKTMTTTTTTTVAPSSTTGASGNETDGCVDHDGKRYRVGEKFSHDCDESCECGFGGATTCKPRCEPPYFRKNMARKDGFCQEIPTSDDCCVILRCTQQETPAEMEPLDGCTHKNQTFHRGEMFNDGCEAICSCGDNGKVQCKPRCPQVSKNSSDQCVHVPDPADPCCTVVFCDVTLGDQDVNKIAGTEETMSDGQLRLKSADALNSTSAIIHFLGEPELESNLTAEISEDQMKWNKTRLDGVIIHDLEPGKTYYIRVVSGGMVSNAVVITLPKDTPEGSAVTAGEVKPANETEARTPSNTTEGEMCHFKGQNYTTGQEFNDACTSYCICTETGVHCSPIECPSEFGLDLLNPHCLKWETRPRDFNPVPPHCCPDKVKCLDDGSCKYMDQVFPNWEEIPTSLTGCEKKCFCEYGNITCHQVCPPVTATPPPDLPCPAQQAMLHNLPGDDCCLYWVCPQIQHPETNKTTKPKDTNRSKDERPPYLGPYNPDRPAHQHHNILAPFGLDESGHPTDPPLPGPIETKDTSAIPGPPYIEHGEHHKTYGFKTSEDEGIHGPPPFVVKPTKEDFDKKHKYPTPDPGAPKPNKTKTKTKADVKPTPVPEKESQHDEEDYDDVGPFPGGPSHFPRPGQPPRPDQPHIIYVNHPLDIGHLPPPPPPPGHRPLPNDIFQGNQNDPNFYHPLFPPPPGKIPVDPKAKPSPGAVSGELSRPGQNFPVHPHLPPQDRRPLPIGLYDGDEEAVLHYHAPDLPDDPRVIAKEILAHLQNTQNGGAPDQAFGAQGPANGTGFAVHHPNVTGFNGAGVPPGFPGGPGPHVPQNGVNIQVLEPLDEHTVRMAFSVPPVLVGLHGRVEVRYTATKHGQDPSTWELQVLAPPGDLIATPQLHFDLGNLLPDTTYSIMIKIILRDLSNTPQSPILTVRTHPASSPITTLPPQIPVDSGLAVAEINSTWAKMMWRKFTDFELQFIDGVQLRYREQDGKVFSATPLIHRLVTSYTIEDLKPNSTYEVGLFFIPFPGQTTELQSERNIEVKTPLENDPYKFDINLEILTTKATTVEVTWSGVPYPEDKYVNIYRVIYQSETGKEDFNTFKVAKRDSTPKMTVTGLKPTTRYRLWLEAYLTNGRTKKSNVQDFVSKPGTVTASTSPSFQGKLSGTPPTMEPGDYYGPLVAVAILAALAIMAALILLLVLMRKHGQNKAAITSTRKTQSAYDNPSYKTCEGDPQAAAAAAANGNGVSRSAEN